MKSFLISALLTVAIAVGATSVRAQTAGSNIDADLNRGIQLFKDGDFQNSVKVLEALNKHAETVSGLTYLGKDYEALGRTSDAKKEYGAAALLSERIVNNWFGSSEETQNSLSTAFYYEVKLGVVAAESYLRLSEKKREEWQIRFEMLRDLINLSTPDKILKLAYSSKDLDTKAKILYKPEPVYTEEARQARIAGTIILKAILGADGKVKLIVPIRTLPNGLTEKAIEVAREIRFVPGVLNGKQVSQWIQVEYHFHVI
jgi:TonB family protein